MKAIARVILVFLGLLFIGAAFFLMVVNYNLIPQLGLYLPAWVGDNMVLAVSAGLLLLALIFLALGLKKKKKAPDAVLKGSEYGEVAISISAIENIVLRVVQQTKGIKDVGRKVSFTTDGLIIQIIIKVLPDVSMPSVTGELQSKTKEYVEEITGITVHEVRVNVENIVVDQAPSRSQGS